jgi:hypothetical protein
VLNFYRDWSPTQKRQLSVHALLPRDGASAYTLKSLLRQIALAVPTELLTHDEKKTAMRGGFFDFFIICWVNDAPGSRGGSFHVA